MNSTLPASTLITSISNRVGSITLNRGGKRNYLDTALSLELRSAVGSLIDQGARAIVLTGAGPVFSAGANLSSNVNSEEFYTTHLSTLGYLQTVPALIISYLNGPAIGAGCQLAMASDVRVLSPQARISIPAVDVGMAMDPVTVSTATSLLGGSLARRLLLMGEKIEYDDLIATGFGVPGDAAAALELAEAITHKAPLSIAQLKLEFAVTGWAPPQDIQRREAGRLALESADLYEAQRAWAEKRRPQFRGE